MKWASIIQAIIYCIVMTIVQIYKKEKYDTYVENETFFVVLVCIAKVVKVVVDLAIHYFFLNFILISSASENSRIEN